MVTILRYMIDDLANTPKYDDERLATLILVSAQFTKSENTFRTSYDVDIENMTLEPDPTAEGTRDDAFINLTLLKAACMLAGSGLSKGGGLLVRENGYSFDDRRVSDARKLQVTTWCTAYTNARKDFSFTDLPVGEAIIGPYRSRDRALPYSCRDRTV